MKVRNKITTFIQILIKRKLQVIRYKTSKNEHKSNKRKGRQEGKKQPQTKEELVPLFILINSKILFFQVKNKILN